MRRRPTSLPQHGSPRRESGSRPSPYDARRALGEEVTGRREGVRPRDGKTDSDEKYHQCDLEQRHDVDDALAEAHAVGDERDAPELDAINLGLNSLLNYAVLAH